MEIILSVLFIAGIWAYFKAQETKACQHSKNYMVDWGKVNDDRIRNNLSNHEVNKNIASGKYDTGQKYKTQAEIRAEQKVSWEQYKKDHPWMPLN